MTKFASSQPPPIPGASGASGTSGAGDRKGRIRRSYVTALAILGVALLWVLSGTFGNTDAPPAGSVAAAKPLFHVKAQTFRQQRLVNDLVLRGHTEAVRKVLVRAQTTGTVVGTPVEKGSIVRRGDLLCELAVDARDARLQEARAVMRQQELEHEAAKQLSLQGHRSRTQTAAAESVYDAARAQVMQMEIELARTRIIAPFDGIVVDRQLEVGDHAPAATPCATLMDPDPLLIISHVSEREVGSLAAGAQAEASLVDGTGARGHIRFISASADPATRTFRVEVEVPNAGGALRDGMTAEVRIPTRTVSGHLLPAATLTLNDSGEIGVRTIVPGGTSGASSASGASGAGDLVRFVPVMILNDEAGGIWVSGLGPEARVITEGQNFVTDGQRVRVSLDGSPAAQGPAALAPVRPDAQASGS